MNLRKIIQGCKNKDQRSRKELYSFTADDVMNVCLRYAVDRDTANDIFQDTYLKVFQKIHQYQSDKGSLGAWISRIAVNTALVYLRKNKRIELVEDFTPVLEPISREDILSDLAAEEIFDLVRSLSDGYRIVFNMYVVEGYAHEEIAKHLGISKTTSRSQLARAKAILRKKIKKKLNPIIHEQA